MHNLRRLPLASLSLALTLCTMAKADDPVFRSETSMSRVDARVVDRDGHAVMGLGPHDFVLHLGDKELPVRNFADENTPIDILLLLDVSGSMEPHVERIAMAAHQALQVLGDGDRVGIMVFDSRTRVRLPFRNNRGDVTRELNKLLDAESFNGATRITSALLDAARYVEREARPDARRAIVVLTDDMTQDQNEEGRVETSLRNARAILSFLRAPYDEPSGFGGGGVPQRRGGGGTWGSGGGGWPGGGNWPGGGGGIGFPGRRGGGMPGMSSPSHSANTETIALESGGDAMNVQEAAALEDTLARLRQRYVLYFYLPEELAGKGGEVRVNLSEMASVRYHGAEIQSRRVFMAGGNGKNSRASEPAAITRVDMPPEQQPRSEATPARRSRAVNENSGPNVNSVGGQTGTASPQPETPPAAQPSVAPAQKGGWPRVTDKPSSPPNQFTTGTY